MTFKKTIPLNCITELIVYDQLKNKDMFTFKKKPLKEDAQHMIDIIDNFSKNKTIKKIISPISDEYFLIDEKNKISICLKDEEVVLSNHVFLYKKMFNLSFTDNLKRKIRENMENEAQELKKSLFTNETNLLSNILKLSSDEKVPLVIRPIFKAL